MNVSKALTLFFSGSHTLAIDRKVDDGVMNIIHSIKNNYTDIPAEFRISVIVECLSFHDPETSLQRFESYLSFTRDNHDLNLDCNETAIIIARVLAVSGALSGKLLSNAMLSVMIVELDSPLDAQLREQYYRTRYQSALAGIMVSAEKVRAVHREHSVQLMRICARNANPKTDIQDLSAELSSLAEATIEICIELACTLLEERFGEKMPEHNLVVLGLGKLGGRELNVSSDIDLIYLISDKTQVYGTKDSTSHHTMLAERLTRILSEPTELGFLYRVDTRLRADGSSGPLVRSVPDYMRYLEMRGEPWERQMLIKARPVAGRTETGHEFLSSVERFIFPSSLTRSPNREIVELKTRIEERLVEDGSKKTHLKLVPGGIRDIEFVTQCLQLLMGGQHPEARMPSTLESLKALLNAKALSDDEYSALTTSYRLYRRIENALQWRELLPAFTLPEDTDGLTRLASYLGYETDKGNASDLLSKEIAASLKKVRNVYNAVFTSGEEDSFEEMTIHAARHPSGDEKAYRFLETVGFGEPEKAARSLTRLVFGENDPLGDIEAHRSARSFVPRLVKKVAELPDPGGALDRIARIALAYGARHVLYNALEESSHFFKLIVSIANGSVFLTDIIVADPSLLDWLVEEGEIMHPIDDALFMKELSAVSAKAKDEHSFSNEVMILKNREKLRAGVRGIMKISETAGTFHALTRVAADVVSISYQYAQKAVAEKHPLPKGFAFCVLAGGRLGADMMDFGSDLDLIFVYHHTGDSSQALDAQQRAIAIAHKMLSLIAGSGGVDRIYEVDARLRPEGGNAVIAVSLDEYKRYFKHRASPWERLALTRSKAVAGDSKFMKDTETAVEAFVYGRAFTQSEAQTLLSIREKMTAQSLKRYPGMINVKSGPGGITDIDFIAQSYTANYGVSNESLRLRSTQDILLALADADIINAHDAKTLDEMYSFLCDVEKALRIGSGRSINTIPASETESYRIAKLMEFKNARRFRQRLIEVTGRVHELYLTMMDDLLQQAPNGETQS